MSIVGARPQFVKAAVVSRALASARISEVLVHTGQHYDEGMSAQFFSELAIPTPVENLGVGSGSHADQTARMLIGIERAILDRRPAVVVVYGDTNSTLAGALAAVKLHVPVVHVEAGLRSFNVQMPEEINRVVTDRVSALLLAPTPRAMANLRAEGYAESSVRLVGDVMYDAVLWCAPKERPLQSRSPYVLATIHRAENTEDRARLAVIVSALNTLSARIEVVLPLHPRTRASLAAAGLTLSDKVSVLPPVGYREMIALESEAALVITDSGGVQKEAYFHRVQCVTVRDETEWTELVDAGWNRLAPPTSAEAVVAAAEGALSAPPPEWLPLYGNGNAGQLVAEAIGTYAQPNLGM